MAETASKDSLLSKHARDVIDEWVKKYPEGRQRSAIFAALREAQQENNG